MYSTSKNANGPIDQIWNRSLQGKLHALERDFNQVSQGLNIFPWWTQPHYIRNKNLRIEVMVDCPMTACFSPRNKDNGPIQW